MKFHTITANATARVTNAIAGINRFAKLERVIAALCISIPALLILFDHGNIRESISAYYSMTEHEVFYFPLTVASMLFVVNGVVKNKHIYNTYLGLSLAGVILFNCQDFQWLHAAFAIAFFGGNGAVILIFTSKRNRWFMILLVSIIVLAILGWKPFNWFALFWAEWISFSIIALHYILESAGVVNKSIHKSVQSAA